MNQQGNILLTIISQEKVVPGQGKGSTHVAIMEGRIIHRGIYPPGTFVLLKKRVMVF